MRNPLSYFLALTVLSMSSLVLASDSRHQIKFGELDSDQVWQGDVYLVSDVIVPEGITLTIKPGTRLFFAEYDISQSGEDQQRAEIIVKGKLDAQSNEQTPILVASIGKSQWKQLPQDEKSVQLEFKPYQIDTTPLKEEFHLFKKQYVIFWTLVYTMWVLVL